ncbi:molybdate ABC transporter substrate-binding protein [Paenibacillus sp. sgz302251]|uniref:molybdate ABC transporter substrate-binding protein n=1 Tax=Paenibacillus sp. sgz302251 TaxID=3414493 RepID=UPI003C7A46F0
MSRVIKNGMSLLLAVSFSFLLTACELNQTETVELTISAAASLTDALQEVERLYAAEHPSIKLHFNFGASGALQQQIEQGAPVDLFLAAASKNMQALIDRGLVDTRMQQSLLQNELVAIVPAAVQLMIVKPEDLTNEAVKHVAVGIPESVPAGSYTKESLTAINLWNSLGDKIVQAKDVRQVLQYVETGNADVGFVYKTDALSSKQVKIAFQVDPSTYPVIQYPVGIIKATKHANEAEELYQFLQTDEVMDVFVKYGFSKPR